ncbi:hypothetical protein TNCV_4952711 [Trichonephila clavipes]|nr:hypothetical protein TNCV_4952711 [Trichonephila clavipes]
MFIGLVEKLSTDRMNPEPLFRYPEGLHRNVGASRFNGPYGRQGCVLARTVESNQGGRFDGNESVADSFRSGAVNFKTQKEKESMIHFSARQHNTFADPLIDLPTYWYG